MMEIVREVSSLKCPVFVRLGPRNLAVVGLTPEEEVKIYDRYLYYKYIQHMDFEVRAEDGVLFFEAYKGRDISLLAHKHFLPSVLESYLSIEIEMKILDNLPFPPFIGIILSTDREGVFGEKEGSYRELKGLNARVVSRRRRRLSKEIYDRNKEFFLSKTRGTLTTAIVNEFSSSISYASSDGDLYVYLSDYDEIMRIVKFVVKNFE